MGHKQRGFIYLVYDEEQISDNFKKRDFILHVPNERDSRWDDYIKFQITQDRCEVLDAFQVGNEVDVDFNIRGRQWEKDGVENYFNNLEAWRIVHAKEYNAQPPARTAQKPAAAVKPPPPPPAAAVEEETDDLPF